jgi:hypothetical protein
MVFSTAEWFPWNIHRPGNLGIYTIPSGTHALSRLGSFFLLQGVMVVGKSHLGIKAQYSAAVS